MKQLLTTIAIIVCLSAKGQTLPTVHIDSSNYRAYAEIEPIVLPYFSDSVSAIRLYVQFRQPIVPAWIATVWYGLYYPRYIDSVTVEWVELLSDVITINTPGTLTGMQATSAAMVYVRDYAVYRGNTFSFEFKTP